MLTCTRCASALPSGARFCGQCGAPVQAAAPAVDPSGSAEPAGFAPPAVAPVAAAEPSTSASTSATSPSPAATSGRRWLLVGCAAVAVAVVGVVVWLVARSGDSAAAGAATPEDVATGFAAAMSNEDLLAAAGYVSPMEMPGLDELLVTLRDAAREQGLNGLSAGDGLDVQLDLRPERVTELADGIARVELTMDLSIDGTPRGPVGGLLGDDGIEVDERDVTEALDADELTVVVVEESGRWYVSPMLTVGEYAADALDLSSPRYDAAAVPDDEVTAPDEEEAVRQLGDAIEQRDASLAAGALAPGEARFVRVFGRALDDLLDRWDGDLSFEALDMSEVAEGRWSIDHLEVSSRDGDDSFGISGLQIDDDCATVVYDLSVRELCLRDLDWVREPLDEDRFVLHITRDGDVARIDLMATVLDDLGQLATRVTRATLLDALGQEVLDTPTPVVVDEPVTLTFAGDGYQVVEWRAAPDRTYLLEPVPGDVGAEVEVYASEDGSDWSWTEWTRADPVVLSPVDGVTRYRAVVRVDVDCDDDGGCRPGEGDVTLTVRRLQVIPSDLGTVVQPMLGPGVSILLQVPADDQHRYEVTTDTDDVQLRTVEYGSVYDLSPDEDGYLVVPYSDSLDVLVTNTGDEEVRAAVALREHPLADGGDGGLPGGDGVELDLSSGEATYEFDVADASSITVTVVPDAGQDVVVDVAPCGFCFTDSGYSGESETVTFESDGESSFTVTVTGYSEADQYGTVTLYVETT